jgi:hypothetical protein
MSAVSGVRPSQFCILLLEPINDSAKILNFLHQMVDAMVNFGMDACRLAGFESSYLASKSFKYVARL